MKTKEATDRCPILTSSRSSSSGQKRSEKERERGWEREWEREWEKGLSTRGTPPVLKNLYSQPGSKKAQEMALKKLTGNQPQKSVTPDQPVVNAPKPAIPVQPVADALDEDTICRKTGTIVDELIQNRNFKVRESYQPSSFLIFIPSSQSLSLYSFVGSRSPFCLSVNSTSTDCHELATSLSQICRRR